MRGNELIEMERVEEEYDRETSDLVEKHCFQRRRLDAELKEIKCR